MKALNPIKASNSSFPKSHFLKAPIFQPFFEFQPFSYNTQISGLHEKKAVLFTVNCKLKNPQDIKNKAKSFSKKIVLSEVVPPPLNQDDDVGDGGNGEVPVSPRNRGGLSGMAKIICEASDFYFQKYPEEHPVLGFFTWRWILTLGFDHMFSSPILLGMLALLGASLMACTYTTQIPLVKVSRRWSFLHSAEAICEQEFSEILPSASIKDVGITLMGAGYEGLAGRLAPIGVHLALLLIMAGGTLSAAGSFRGSVTVPQGLNFVVGDVLGPTGFFSSPTEAFNTEIHVNRFYMDYYDSGEVSQFHTDLSLFDMDGKEVLRKTISVNNPLGYGGITIYQTDWSFSALQILKDNEGPYNLAMAPLKINGDKKLFGTFLPVGYANSPDVKGISMLARDLQSIVLYDKEGKFAGVRRPNSKLLINIDGTEIVIVDAVGSSGLDLKTDPGVPVVYAGFGALMLTTCISFLSHSQIWALQDGTEVIIGGKTKRGKMEFPEEMIRLLVRFLK